MEISSYIKDNIDMIWSLLKPWEEFSNGNIIIILSVSYQPGQYRPTFTGWPGEIAITNIHT